MAIKGSILCCRFLRSLCGHLVWNMQFCWHGRFNQFFILRVVSLSVCIPLFYVFGLSPSCASTRAVALITTCVDMTGILSEDSFLLPLSFFNFSYQHPLANCTHGCIWMCCFSHYSLHSHSPSAFLSVSLCLSPYQGFLINGEPWCLSYQQITLLSINCTDRAGRLQAMDDTHTQLLIHCHIRTYIC